jgi:hypothetical protein
MNMLLEQKKQVYKSSWWIGVGLCFVITGAVCYSLLFNLTKPLSLTHNDVYQNMFIIKHIMDTILSGAWQNLSTLPMFYGFENSYFFNEPFILHAIAGLPMYMITGNIIVTYNLLAVCTILASLIAVYVFAYHITGKCIQSVIAATVAVLNPFIMGRFPDHLNLVTLVFLPLIFLFVERILKRPSPVNCLVLFLLLTGQLLTSFYYAAFLSLILPVYVIVRWWQVKTDFRKLLQWGTVVGAILFLLVVAGMVKVYSGTFLFSESSPELDRRQLLYFSAWPTDWLFAGEQSVLYGGIRAQVASRNPDFVHQGTPSEQNIFPGITVIILGILALLTLRKTAYRQHFLLFTGILLFSIVLSFGPIIHLTQFVILPGVFDIVSTLDPILRMTRVTARFAVFVFLFGGVIIAMAVDTIVSGNSRIRRILPVIILFIILAEYWNYPLQFLTILPLRMDFYNRLNAQKNIHVILDVPVGDAMLSSGGNVRQEYLDSHYMLWATIAHNKKLIGGYEGFMPLEYYIRMKTISTGFPSPDTIREIRKWGTDAIILHEDEYTHPTDYHLAKVKLTAMGVPLVEETDGLAFFDLTGIDRK